MEKDLSVLATDGVFAEFCDALGNLVAQEVFFDWHAAPLPAVGDLFSCTSPRGPHYRPRRIVGRVRSRYFDLQRDQEGVQRVWVRLVLEVCSPRLLDARRWAAGCSLN